METVKYTVKLLRSNEERSIDNSDIIELNINEDIFSFCMAGNMLFYDKSGFIELLEITGTEPIIIMWEEEGIKIEKLFIVYNFDKIIEEVDIDNTIIKVKIFFIEVQYFNFSNVKKSKAWGENIYISDIVKDICKNYVGIENFKNFEETNEKISNFYIPYWYPAEALRWLMKRASGKNSKLPGYLLYSNSLGYNFQTLDTMVSKTEREIDTNGENVKYIFTGEGNNYNKILNWYITPFDCNSYKTISGSTIYGYNFNGKNILKKEYKYVDSIKKFNILGSSTLFSDISDSSVNIEYNADNTDKIIDNRYYHDFINTYSKQFAASLIVKGHTRRYAGMIIDVSWRSSDKIRRTHKMYEGLYLVKSITHQFVNTMNVAPSYRQLMVCLKTGYNMTDLNNLIKTETNKNIADSYVKDRNA